jgi:hypothetical protein
VNGEAEIRLLRRPLLALIDADLVLPGDGQWLLATLEAALQRLIAGDPRGAGAAVERLVERLQVLMEAGVLQAGDGGPWLDRAAAVLALLHGDG